VDKTGTLTEGKPKLVDVRPLTVSTRRNSSASPPHWNRTANTRSPPRLCRREGAELTH